MADRPFITCHVLETTSGKPAAGVAVTLQIREQTDTIAGIWSATTNNDGRVTNWEAQASTPSLNTVVGTAKNGMDDGAEMIWSLTFETGAYYGRDKTFWPQVELRFATKKHEDHYHVPLLLGPWSYTTYRGS